MIYLQVPKSPCPECKYVLDGAASLVGDYAPAPGDVTVCRYCGAILRFTEDLTLVVATESDLQVGRCGLSSYQLTILRAVSEVVQQKTERE